MSNSVLRAVYRRRSRFATVKAKLGGNALFLPLPEYKWQLTLKGSATYLAFYKTAFLFIQKEIRGATARQRKGRISGSSQSPDCSALLTPG